MNLGAMNRRIRFEQQATTQDANYGPQPSGTWTAVATIWANVQDALPSRGETQGDVRMASMPVRIRCRYRTGLTGSMRIVLVDRSRTLKIISGPAEIGLKQGLEFMAEEFSTSGDMA